MEPLTAFALIGLVVSSTAMSGDWFLQRAKISFRSTPERFVAGSALGLGIWMLSLFATGCIFAFTKTVALIQIVPFVLIGVIHSGAYFRTLRGTGMSFPRDTLFWAGMSFFLVFLAIGVLSSFAPVAEMSDALTYHLNLPKQYARLGKIVPLVFDVNSCFPQLLSAGFGFGLLFGSASFANLLSLWISVLCAALVYSWSRRYGRPGVALLASLAFLWIPAIYNHLVTPYVDIALALYACLSFLCFLEWVEQKQGSLLGLSGAFAGLALGTKFLEMFYIILLLVCIGVEGWRSKLGFRKIVSGTIAFVFWCALLGSLWYARSAWVLGNPVYPFWAKWIGHAPALFTWNVYSQGLGSGTSLKAFVSFFWNATFRPELFAGFGTRWNILLLGLLPLVIWDRMQSKPRLDWLTLLALATLCIWFWSIQVMRFLFPFLVLYAVMMAGALERWFSKGRWARLATAAWIFGVGCSETAVFAAHSWPAIQVGLGITSKEDFLSQRERSYRMARWANQNLPQNAMILSSGEGRLYYFNRPAVRDNAYRPFTKYHLWASDAKAAVQAIRQEGFTHVLVCRLAMKDARQVTRPEESRRFALEDLVQDPALFSLLHTEEYTDRSGNRFLYELYAIVPSI